MPFDDNSHVIRAPQAMLTRLTVCGAVIPLLCSLKRREFKYGGTFNFFPFDHFVSSIQSMKRNQLTGQ